MTSKRLPALAAPVVATAPARNGALVVALTSSVPGATIYYTVDGSRPGKGSPKYAGAFLVATNETVNSVANAPGYADSPIRSQTFSPNIPSGTLVWADEFARVRSSDQQPDPAVWAYDTGAGGWGNHELENYCGWASSAPPCTSSARNVYVGIDGYLHIVARRTPGGIYSSARIKTQGLFNFQYGRLEFRVQVPEGVGLWAASWLLGSNFATAGWPSCGEMDVLEHVTTASAKDSILGSIHGTGFTGGEITASFPLPSGKKITGWHTYGMIWSKGKVAYYLDNPTKPYATFTPASLHGRPAAVWPFDAGPSFIVLNAAVGGDLPSAPTASTHFPAQMLVDFVRIYTN